MELNLHNPFSVLTADPNVKSWRPHRVQEQFLSLPDSIFEGFYGGAAGGGKTEVLLMNPIVRGFFEFPDFKGLILRRTFPELEKEVIPRSMEYYKPTGASYNDQKKKWTFPSGATIEFGHAEYEKDIRKYDSAEYNYIAFDELTSFTEFQYLYLALTRARSSNPNLPSIVRSASNPGNIGHGWVRKRFIEPYKLGRKILVDQKTGQKRIFIPAKLYDNPHLMNNDPQYEARLRMLPTAEQQAKLDGDWWTFSGQVFDSFREFRFPDEPENALHVIDPFEIPEYWPRILAIDWGFAAFTWAGWFAVAPDGRIYLYREKVWKQTLISDWATEIKQITEPLVLAVIDPSAQQRRGDKKNIKEQVEFYSGIQFELADNDRVGGKSLFQDYLRWIPKPVQKADVKEFNKEEADRLLRMEGLDAYKNFLGSYVDEEPENNIPKLQIFRTCPEIIKTIPLCVYNTSPGKDPEDVAEFNGDDPYDGCRYGLKAVHRYVEMSKTGHESAMRASQAILDLQATGNQTAFYRRMEIIENFKKHLGVPVSRYHKKGYKNARKMQNV